MCFWRPWNLSRTFWMFSGGSVSSVCDRTCPSLTKVPAVTAQPAAAPDSEVTWSQVLLSSCRQEHLDETSAVMRTRIRCCQVYHRRLLWICSSPPPSLRRSPDLWLTLIHFSSQLWRRSRPGRRPAPARWRWPCRGWCLTWAPWFCLELRPFPSSWRSYWTDSTASCLQSRSATISTGQLLWVGAGRVLSVCFASQVGQILNSLGWSLGDYVRGYMLQVNPTSPVKSSENGHKVLTFYQTSYLKCPETFLDPLCKLNETSFWRTNDPHPIK